MNGNNVSVEKIQQGIDYLENQFMRPLEQVGEQLLDNYKEFNNALQSEAINRSIQEQQSKLDELRSELEKICAKAKGDMEESSSTVKQNQANIDDVLSNI